MKNEKLRIIKIAPNSLPILDEIYKADDICYFTVANDKIQIDRNSADLRFIDFGNNVVGIYYNARDYKEADKTYFYSGTYEYEFLERNTQIPESVIFGDIIILGTYQKLEDGKQVEKYKSVTIEQIDQYIEMFKSKEGLNWKMIQ